MDRIFCLTASTFHRSCFNLLLLCLVGGLTVSVANAQGRRGGGGSRFGGSMFGGGDFLERMDRDGDGELDEDEIPEQMRGFLESQGIDTSRGVSFDDFESARESMRARFSEGFGFGGRGFGDGDNERRDGEGDDRRRRDDDDDDGDRSEREPRPRVTFDLPPSHSVADTDRDGQLGMYEWRRWSGHSLREFLEMDRNGDGFVTPREVYVVIGFPDPESNGSSSGGPVIPTSSTPATASLSSGDSASPLSGEATRYFGILDKDRDGVLSLSEWESSVRIRGMFEDDGLDLSEPMSSEQFVQHYVRLSNQDR